MDNITQEQRDLLGKLQEHDPELEIHWDELRGVASSVRGKLGNYAQDVEAGNIDGFLNEYGVLFGPPELPKNLQLLRHKKDEINWDHLTFQFWLGDETEVYGAKLAAHVDAEGGLIQVQSSLFREIKVETDARVSTEELQKILLRRIEKLPGIDALMEREGRTEKLFPITDPPRLVNYFWKGEFRPVWVTYGYSDLDEAKVEEENLPRLAYGRIFVDAATGERIIFSPALQTAENPTTGSGLAVTPLTGTHTTRSLNIVRVDSSSTYYLKDTTRNRDIITYDAACSSSYESRDEIDLGIRNDTLSVSEDTDGDHNWDRLPTSTTAAQRTSGQQPEVDAHYLVGRQYEWYDAISGGRDGWDDGNYPNPPVPDQTINVIAHCRFPGGTCQEINAYCFWKKRNGTFVYWLAFMDGNATTYDYLAGSHFIVAHEYQHAITNFSFENGAHDPGLDYIRDTWYQAVHEGLSDAFGGLSTEEWLPCRDISPATPAQVFRNLVFPRDANAHSANRLDHFDDRNTTTSGYSRGTILANCAYLMGKGGVHQRVSRSPEYIPVYSPGRTTVGGMDVPKAARIWYRALTHYFSTHGALIGIPANDQDTFRTLRNGCVSAAADLYGSGSAEHRNTILAFYAVGLPPQDTDYGADVTFLRWGVSWDLSRNYVGLTSHDYQSLDLFINNGISSEWNAIINVNDPSTGAPTDYENTVYCRVRNVGDQDATNVQVAFHYAKAGTATWNWEEVKDNSGTVQTLNIGTLAAGQSNFADSAQNSPPATASVKWSIPPLAPGEVIDHYCLRATVTCSNDVNPHNNVVQSNVAYTAYSPPSPATMILMSGNPFEELEIPLELRLDHTLPVGWDARIQGVKQGEWLRPGEERPFELIIKMAPGADERLETPLDGDLFGEVGGDVEGKFEGSLIDTTLRREVLDGNITGLVNREGTINGRFEGTIDLKTGEVQGQVIGSHSEKLGAELRFRITGCLRPWRRVNVSQWHDGELVGGVTVQVQVPWDRGPCTINLPPTDIQVRVPRK
jgi:Zn-dependent metalloprotease